jgi:hypothetical protein
MPTRVMKPVRVRVVNSTTRRGMLSIRFKPGDPTATRIYEALTASGAQPGDILELRAVPMKTCPECKGRKYVAGDALMEGGMPIDCINCDATGTVADDHLPNFDVRPGYDGAD